MGLQTSEAYSLEAGPPSNFEIGGAPLVTSILKEGGHYFLTNPPPPYSAVPVRCDRTRRLHTESSTWGRDAHSSDSAANKALHLDGFAHHRIDGRGSN